MDFDNPKVYGDTSITDGLVFHVKVSEQMFFAANHVEILVSMANEVWG